MGSCAGTTALLGTLGRNRTLIFWFGIRHVTITPLVYSCDGRTRTYIKRINSSRHFLLCYITRSAPYTHSSPCLVASQLLFRLLDIGDWRTSTLQRCPPKINHPLLPYLASTARRRRWINSILSFQRWNVLELVRVAGIEPATLCSQSRCATAALHSVSKSFGSPCGCPRRIRTAVPWSRAKCPTARRSGNILHFKHYFYIVNGSGAKNRTWAKCFKDTYATFTPLRSIVLKLYYSLPLIYQPL